MSLIKKILAASYSLRMNFSKFSGIGINVSKNHKKIKAPVSFFSLYARTNNGEQISFENFRGKKLLLVNLASKCGYTPQYHALEKLHRQSHNFTLLGFPSDDFGGQEPGSDKEINNFCRKNFGITFPLFAKDHVKGTAKQTVYQWLCNAEKNGWNDKEPAWNFYKYLVDEEGNLISVFSSSVSPMSDEILNALK